MPYIAEHCIFGSEERAIDFRFTSSNTKLDWDKENLTTKAVPLYYLEDISVSLSLQFKSGYENYSGRYYSHIETFANFTNSSDQSKILGFKLCGICPSTDGSEEILWEESYSVEIHANNENNAHRHVSTNDKFYNMIRSDNFDLIVRVVEFHVTKDVFNYKDERDQWNLLSMYKDDSFKDVKFVIGQIGDQSIMAHRAVLALRSEVFRSMLTLDTKEKKEGIIRIEDTNAPSFEAFIKYLYTNEKIDKIEEVASDLVVLADKYDIQCLKKRCEIYLSGTINVDNATSLLIKADKYNCHLLKEQAIFFIKSQLYKLKEHLPDLQQDPHLLTELLQSLADDKGIMAKKMDDLTLENK